MEPTDFDPTVDVSVDVAPFLWETLEWFTGGDTDRRERMINNALTYRFGQLSMINEVAPYQTVDDVFQDALAHFLRHLISSETDDSDALSWFDEQLAVSR